MKKCSKYKQIKKDNEFYKDKARYDNLDGICKLCRKAAGISRRLNNIDKLREIGRRCYAKDLNNNRLKARARRYGVSLQDIENMTERQHRKCLICGKLDKLFIDHDHKTGKIRGLLCNQCNLAVGYLDDNPAKLMNAIRYLEIYGR